MHICMYVRNRGHTHVYDNKIAMLLNVPLYRADAYTGRDLSLFATINKQELLLLIKII